jgi:hypothetical protein
MRQCGIHRDQELLAIADAAMIFAPSHFSGIRSKVGAGDMMMRPYFGAAQT